MQRMRPNVPPEPIQPNLLTRSFRASNFKHTRRDSEAGVRRHDFSASHPLSELSALPRRKLRARGKIPRVLCVDGADLFAGLVGEGYSGAQVGVEVAISSEDVEFVRCVFFVLLLG